jgi:glucose-6-phosphate 1-dehydrogenase
MTSSTLTPDALAVSGAATAAPVTEPCAIVLFGASGDLAHRMVVPAIFRLMRHGLLHPDFHLIGYARTKMTNEEFRASMREAVMRSAKPGDAEAWPQFAARLFYVPGEYSESDVQGYVWLTDMLARCERELPARGRRLFYLATPPTEFAPILRRLSEAGLAGRGYRPPEDGWARVIIEKPFGRDLASARLLNAQIKAYFSEHDVYRIDHFLGKEAVQNLFAFRFANAVFEPVWNRNYIDHVQITAAETLGVEGRGRYYETAGALRDMVQNHLLQLCALVCIEPPAEWNSHAVRNEKVKVLRAVRRIKPEEVLSFAVRGQYAAGEVEGRRVPPYREETDVAPDSTVETYAALKIYIQNWRWAGVPFYLRTGKRLAARRTEIAVEFKPPPHTPFGSTGNSPSLLESNGVPPGTLVVSISPAEGLLLRVEGKKPGYEMRLRPVALDYCSSRDPEAADTPSAYEHLLLDALRGDPTFFARADEVEEAWEIVEPVLERWEAEEPSDFPNYRAGSSGPAADDELLARDGRRWRDLMGESACR